MAAPRATQFIALRNLSRGSQHVRSLHLTGPATYASPTQLQEPSNLRLPNDIAGLRAECRLHKTDATGGKSDPIARLRANEITPSRAFSTAIQKATRSTHEREPSAMPAVRHFNTSRELKAVKDSSPVDFTYLPDMHQSEETADPYVQVRVPILPNPDAAFRPHLVAEPEEAAVMKPQISTVSADAFVLPFAESHDDHAMHIDFHAMADRVAANLRSLKAPAEKQAGVMKQILGDMVDDLMGLKKISTV